MAETPAFLDMRGDMLRFSTLPRPLRVLVAFTLALALGGLAFQALEALPIDLPITYESSGQVQELGVVSVVLVGMFVLVGRTCLIAAAPRFRWWAGAPLLLLATFPIVVIGTALEVDAVRAVVAGALLILWAYFAVRQARFRVAPLAADLAVAVVLGLTIDLGVPFAWVMAGTYPSWSSAATTMIFNQLFGLFFVFGVPVLLSLGVDFALLGAEGSTWLVARVARRASSDRLAVGVVALGIVKVVYHLVTVSPRGLRALAGTMAVLAAIAAGALVSYRVRHQHWDVAEPPLAWMLVLAVLFVVWTTVPAFLYAKFDVPIPGYTLRYLLVAISSLALALLALVAARRGAR